MRFKVGKIVPKLKKKVTTAVMDLITDYEYSYKQHLAEGVMLVRNAAIKAIRDQKPGRLQKRYGPKRVVRVSAPGDAPNTDLGTLIKSIGWNIDADNGIGEVGTNYKVGKMLEFGTSEMEARPWLYPALEASKPKLQKIFRKGRGKRAISGGD